jgi:hypothetical protein
MVQQATARFGVQLLLTAPTREDLPESLALRRLGRVRWPGVKGTVDLHELHGISGSAVWTACRDSYESALELFESGSWGPACERLLALVDLNDTRDHLDKPTLKLLRRAFQCLEAAPEVLEPVIECEEH